MGEKPEPQEIDIIGSYLANVRGTVPLAIEEIDAILRLIAAARDPIRTFLDLSCNGGTLAAAILGEYPDVTGFLIEDSSARLEATRQRLGVAGERVTFRTARYASTAWSELAAQHAPYDVVIGGAELWPVPDDRKREIFREVHGLLSPGGLFQKFGACSLRHSLDPVRHGRSGHRPHFRRIHSPGGNEEPHSGRP